MGDAVGCKGAPQLAHDHGMKAELLTGFAGFQDGKMREKGVRTRSYRSIISSRPGTLSIMRSEMILISGS